MRTLGTKTEKTKIDPFFNYQEVEKMDLHNLAECLCIYTAQEAKPEVNCDWFFQIIGETNIGERAVIYDAFGKAGFCECASCTGFGSDLLEYISILKSLVWAESYAKGFQIQLWVSSSEFITDENEQILSHYEEIYQCPFLQKLGKQLASLLYKTKAEVFQYSYANKEIIPDFF